VTVAVGRVAIVVDEVHPRLRSTLELPVRRQDPGVDDVGVHARPGEVVAVAVVQRQLALVHAVEAPGRVGLAVGGVESRLEPHPPIGLDVGDGWVRATSSSAAPGSCAA